MQKILADEMDEADMTSITLIFEWKQSRRIFDEEGMADKGMMAEPVFSVTNASRLSILAIEKLYLIVARSSLFLIEASSRGSIFFYALSTKSRTLQLI